MQETGGERARRILEKVQGIGRRLTDELAGAGSCHLSLLECAMFMLKQIRDREALGSLFAEDARRLRAESAGQVALVSAYAIGETQPEGEGLEWALLEELLDAIREVGGVAAVSRDLRELAAKE